MSTPAGLSELVNTVQPSTFLDAAISEVQNVRSPLTRIQDAFCLTDDHFGGLLGWSADTVNLRRSGGVPTANWLAPLHIVATVDMLERKLLPDRLAAIATTPASMFGGDTLLHALSTEPAGTREACAAAFDCTVTA